MERKIILFNCSTNVVGGGVKNSALFIIESLKISDGHLGWKYAISLQVADVLETKGIQIDNKFVVFKDSPAKSKSARKKLLQIALVNKVDLVYTMAGPAYVGFPMTHVQGLSNAYITHMDWSILLLNKGFIRRTILSLKIFIRFYLSRRADYFIFQTNVARDTYSKRAKIDKNKTVVIPNSFDLEFLKFNDSPAYQRANDTQKKIQIFCPGAAYIHKGFQFIPGIANELNKMIEYDFEFVLTLPESPLLTEIKDNAERLGVSEFIKNVGPYNYANVRHFYSTADVVFVPSLLETFSATYLESIIMQKKLIVADKKFASDVCGDYAFYVNPKDFKETARTIFHVLDRPNSPKEDQLDLYLKQFGNQQNRFNKIVEFLTSKL